MVTFERGDKTAILIQNSRLKKWFEAKHKLNRKQSPPHLTSSFRYWFEEQLNIKMQSLNSSVKHFDGKIFSKLGKTVGVNLLLDIVSL